MINTSDQIKEAPAPVTQASMTEAGFSLNVKLRDPYGSEVMLTFRAPMASQSARLLTHYSETIAKLLDKGWRVLNGPAQSHKSDEAAPVCEFHGPMKASTARPGTYYCPKRLGNGEYCKSKG